MIRWIFPNIHVSRSLTLPATTLLDIPPQEQEQMLAVLRRARYGDLSALHVLLLCARGRHPTAIAAVLFCSRSSVYRVDSASIVLANWASPSTQTANSPPLCGRRSCCPWCSAHWLHCSRPHPAVWLACRTRWSCAT